METNDVLRSAPLSIPIPQDFYDDLDRRIRKAVAEAINGTVNEPQKSVKFLTRKQLCGILNISLPTLHSYCKKGLIKGKKVGNRVLFDEQVIKDNLHDLPVKISMR